MNVDPLHSRRNFLRAFAAVAALACASGVSADALKDPAVDWKTAYLSKDRTLWLQRGKDTFECTYWSSEQRALVKEGYFRASWLLRDVKFESAVQMDQGLLDVLYLLQSWLKYYGHHYPLVITSGFRTKKHNSRLERAALNSMHLYGKAADWVMPSVSGAILGRMARHLTQELGLGGAGIYPNDDFVHTDSGRLRYWIGQGPEPSLIIPHAGGLLAA
jgi:uncharacterized protein YcbK (DUF882 family)